MKFLFAFLFLLHNISFSQVSQLLDLQEEVVVQADSASQAQEKAQQEVLEKFVQKFAIDLIGEKKYEQNKISIRQFAIKDSGKFAPVMKSQVKEEGGQFLVSMNMKVSASNLRQLFEKAGYLSSDVDSGVVLPFISIVDQLRTKTFKWWVSDSLPDDVAREVNRSFNEELQKALRISNFYLMNATDWNFKNSLPYRLQKDYFRKDDYVFIDRYFKFPLSVKGQVDLMPGVKTSNKLQVKLEVILNNQGRVIAETSRSVDLEAGDLKSSLSKVTIFKEVSEDIADQMSAALRKGLFESSMIYLVLSGKLNYKNTENFKAILQKSLGGLRYISERTIESGERTYEVDYSGSSEELARKIEALKFQGFQVVTRGVSQQKVELKLQ